MKNFPHQVNNLDKLTSALVVARDLINGGQQLDDGTFGEALALAGVYTFRHPMASVAANIAAEKLKPASDQGFRTAARDLKRFLSIAGLLAPAGHHLTTSGMDIVTNAGNQPLRNALWRDALLQMRLDQAGNVSHPYRILLALVADNPGIETSKLMLALEPLDDSDAEYQRIVALLPSTIQQIIIAVGTTPAGARNAVKILPALAEQIGDIERRDQHAYPTSLPISSEDSLDVNGEEKPTSVEPTEVDASEISKLPNFNELTNTVFDLAAALEMQRRRTIQHHNLVRSIAGVLKATGFQTYERPFDCVGFKAGDGGILIEVKTIDGSRADERKQSERALGQVKGYRHFNVPNQLANPKLVEVVAFSEKPTSEGLAFLHANQILSAWPDGDQWLVAKADGTIVAFSGDNLLA